jgi:hypothetical protein
MTTVVEFEINAEPQAWRQVGFDVDGDGLMRLGAIRLRIKGSARASGITGWVLGDAPDPAVSMIDGLATSHGPLSTVDARDHPNGALGIDHVVVYTPDLERTCAAIESATGAELKRIREAGSIRQGFHRIGELIVEVVTFPGVEGPHARFWGLAINVRDLDRMWAELGDSVMSEPKQAVQPGRRIASIRESAGLGLPLALMTRADRSG